jgi:hypothetical protein
MPPECDFAIVDRQPAPIIVALDRSGILEAAG